MKSPDAPPNLQSQVEAEVLASRVTVYRALKQLSQTELAERAGISRPTVSRIERGEGAVTTLETIGKIAEVFGVSSGDLITPDRAIRGSVNARDLHRAIADRYSKAGRPRQVVEHEVVEHEHADRS